jgi:hypothetical protein
MLSKVLAVTVVMTLAVVGTASAAQTISLRATTTHSTTFQGTSHRDSLRLTGQQHGRTTPAGSGKMVYLDLGTTIEIRSLALKLSGGTINALSTRHEIILSELRDSGTGPITGGTGRYAHARGTVKLTQTGAGPAVYKLSIRLH